MSVKPIKVHLFSGFLGAGKTTAIRSLIAQKSTDEQWLVIVNEFGEIGIDGAVLSDNGIPVAEISGGCLCCAAGEEMTTTIRKMLSQHRPNRIIIEASGLAHASGIIDEFRSPEFADVLEVSAVLTVVDPRQFIDTDYAENPLYKGQISVCDVLVATKIDLCSPQVMAEFHDKAVKLFPPKSLIVETNHAQADIAWLDTPLSDKSRYRVAQLPDNKQGFQSQGYVFPAEQDFNPQRLANFFNQLPQWCEGLVRAKGVFKVWDTWVWLNWVDGQWGATQVEWRRDSRFELIAQSFDGELINKNLCEAFENENGGNKNI